MKKISILFFILFERGISNPSQRAPIDPGSWGDSSSVTQKEPLSRDELLRNFLFTTHHKGEIHVEDFLWTGSGDSELPMEDYDIASSIMNGGSEKQEGDFINYIPTTLTVTHVSTILSTVHPAHPLYPYEPNRIDPTRTYSMSDNSFAPHISYRNFTSSKKLPNEKYLVRTVVVSNMTVIRRDIERFKKDMELKLEKAYKQAYLRKMIKRNEDGAESHLVRKIRQVPRENEDAFERPRVKIHNIRSSLPEPEIEMLYTVYEDDEPVLAEKAVETLLDNIDDKDAENFLGFPLITKAEPYVQRLRANPTHTTSKAGSTWMIAAVILCTLFILALLLLLLLLAWNRCNDEREHSGKHRRLVSSPLGSKTSSIKDRRRAEKKEASPSLDRATFTLDRPGSSKPSLGHVSSDQDEYNEEYEDCDKIKSAPEKKMASSASSSSRASTVIESSNMARTTYGDCATSMGSLNAKVDRAESPILADLSSNETPETQHRSKRSKHLTKKNKSKRVSPGDRHSAFPSITPDRAGWLGPLSDLLEEDADYNEGDPPRSPDGISTSSDLSSSTVTTTSSSSVLSSSKNPWKKEALKAKETSVRYSNALNKVFPPDSSAPPNEEDEDHARAISAKSHIFRKGTVESRLSHLGKSNRTRPWSASESRGDPTFKMRQRHWEGLIAGKKHLHRGQLLPGSTSSEDDDATKVKPPATCWSECSSPRKQVRIQENEEGDEQKQDPAGPLIQAIKDELQKFHRAKSPNLAGITIINDPELVQRESSA